jgi:hypothetical protein
MKEHTFIILLSIILTALTGGCTKEEPEMLEQIDFDTVTFEPSMKGWELYSWPNGSEWNYSLLIGTNVTKTYEAVTGNRYKVTGVDSLKLMLAKLPAGEEIFWISENWVERIWDGDSHDLRLPPNAIIEEVEEYCAGHQLVLSVSD